MKPRSGVRARKCSRVVIEGFTDPLKKWGSQVRDNLDTLLVPQRFSASGRCGSMVQDPKIRSTARPLQRPDSIASGLRVKLEDEAHLLESLVSSLSRGQSLPEVWSLLHEAAARDDRMSDLAFAYERLTQDRKLKFL